MNTTTTTTTYRIIVGDDGYVTTLRHYAAVLDHLQRCGFTVTSPTVRGGVVAFTATDHGDALNMTAPWRGQTYVNGGGGTWTLDTDGAWWHPAGGDGVAGQACEFCHSAYAVGYVTIQDIDLRTCDACGEANSR
jgi:hypothetical protein